MIHQIYECKPGKSMPHTVCKWTESVRTMSKASGYGYKLWSDPEEINDFVKEHFFYCFEKYKSLHFDVQRWDILRLMILYVEGSVYIDTDVQLLKPIKVMSKKEVAFALEPAEHAFDFERRPFLIGTYFIEAEAGNEFIKYLIDTIFAEIHIVHSIHNPTQIIKSTGPAKITELYNRYPHRFDVGLIPSERLSPLTAKEARKFALGRHYPQAERAYGVHYYTGSWTDDTENKDSIELISLLRNKFLR